MYLILHLTFTGNLAANSNATKYSDTWDYLILHISQHASDGRRFLKIAFIFKVLLGEVLSPVIQSNLNSYSYLGSLWPTLPPPGFCCSWCRWNDFQSICQSKWPPIVLMNIWTQGFMLGVGDQHWISVGIIRKPGALVMLESSILGLPSGAMAPRPGCKSWRLHCACPGLPVLPTEWRPCPPSTPVLSLLGWDTALWCPGHSDFTTIG